MDYAEQIIQCYQHLSSSTNVEQASKLLEDFYSEHKAFPVLISILNSDNDETIKRYAALGLKITLRNCWKDSDEKEEFLKPIFFLLMTTNSILVSSHLIQIIIELVDSLACEMIVAFVNQTVSDDEESPDPSFNYPMAIYSSLRLLDACIEDIGINENTIPLYQKVISIGAQINEPPIQIAAISCTFHLTFICRDDLGLGPIFPQSLALLQSLSGTPHIDELLNVFHVMMDHLCPLINPHLLIQQILNIILNSDEDYNIEEKRHAFSILIDVLRNYSEDIFPVEDQSSDMPDTSIISNSLNNYAEYIFKATSKIVSELFQENDAYDMSPYDLIEPIAEQFSAFDNLLESFWEQITEMQQVTYGQFLAIVFLRSSFDDGYDFYKTKITDIATLLCSVASETQSSCLREASILALCSFSKTFVEEITEMKSKIQEVVFDAVTTEPSIEILNAFEELINSTEDSDCIFERSLEFLTNLITVEQVGIQMKEQILWCISELIKNSQQEVEQHFQGLFDICKEISDIDTKNDNSQSGFKSAAIYCLSHLCKKCPAQFEPYAEEFAKYIVSNIADFVTALSEEAQDDDSELNVDSSLAIQLINAYWYVVENEQEYTNSTIGDMINLLIQICEASSQYLSNEIYISNMIGSVSVNGIALRVLCGCASKCPNILQNIIQQLLGFIVACPSKHSALATNWIASAINSLPNRAEIVPQLVNILIEMIDSSTDLQQTSKCYESLAILIDWCGAVVVDDQVLQTAGKAFTLELPCFNDDDKKDDLELVFTLAQEVFMQAINALQDAAFQKLQAAEFQTKQNISYFDLFFKLAESKSKSMKNHGLQILAEIVGETPEGQIPSPFLERLFETAANEAMEGNCFGFHAIKKLSCSSSFNTSYSENIKLLIPKMVQRLYSNSPYTAELDPMHTTESTMVANDNCVSALGSILMNIFGDNLVESFNIFDEDEDLKVPILLVILSAMPPKIDFSENESIMEFFFWLFEKAEGRFIEQFAEVLVNIFTEPVDVLKGTNSLTEVTIQRLNEMLVQLVPNCGGEQFCSTVLDGDENKLAILNSYLVSE